MAKIRLEFGGIAPSVDPRRLGPAGAQVAENLDLRFGDFRPLKGPGASVQTVSSGTKSLHRTPSGVWLHSTNDVNYVNGQVNDAASERVYLTGRVGYPEAWQSGTYRRLGVPKPAAKPTVVQNVVDEYTGEENQAAFESIVSSLVNQIVSLRTPALVGNAMPTTGYLGGVWLANGAVAGLPSTSNQQVNYAIPLSAVAPTLTATNVVNAYLLDPSLGGKLITYTSADYWAVTGRWRSQGYTVDQTALATWIKTVKKPPENVDQLVPDATADEIAARLVALFSVASDPVMTMVNDINLNQYAVIAQLSRTDSSPGRANALAAAATNLANSVMRLDDYYANLNANLRLKVDEVLAPYSYLVPPTVTRIEETRGYIYTYVTDWYEESQPSDPSDLLTVDQNDTVGITVTAPPSGRNVVGWRLYRGSTTDEGAEYQLISDPAVGSAVLVDGAFSHFAIGTLTYTDSKKQEELQEVCPSTIWAEPRADMFGLIGMPNGIMVGLANGGKTLCFCEAYRPFAWPRDFEIALEHDGVGIGVFGQTAVVLTEGKPYYVSGADPASMSSQQIESSQSCLSKRSIVSSEGGVMFASPDGLCLASAAGVEIMTLGVYDKEDWQALGLTNSFGALTEGVYRLVVGSGTLSVLSLDVVARKLGKSPATTESALYTDLLTDTLYASIGTTVVPLLVGSALTAEYRSGIYTTNDQPTFGWVRVAGSSGAAVVRVYANGSLVHTTPSLSMNTPARLPAVRGREWEVRVDSSVHITDVVMASTAAELVS